MALKRTRVRAHAEAPFVAVTGGRSRSAAAVATMTCLEHDLVSRTADSTAKKMVLLIIAPLSVVFLHCNLV